MTMSAEEFLQKKVRGIIEPMVSSLLMEKPKEPILFMIEWLQNFSGLKSVGPNMERIELENLRKEMSKHKKKFVTEDEEAAVHSDSDQDEEQDKVDSEVDEYINKRKLIAAQKGQRSSVSAEVFGMFNKKEDFKSRVIPKTNEQKERMMKTITKSILFQSLEDQELHTVIDAFEEVNFGEKQFVITQGEQGEVLYLIETGQLSCFKKFSPNEEPKFLKHYYPGEYFGELALLHNAPRAASIQADIDCTMWALDRETFNHIVKDAAIKKRQKYDDFLASVEILKSIDNYERSQICEALQVKKVHAGDYIIKQNEPGDVFYMIEEGEAYAEKVFNAGEEAKVVLDYSKGDYFGELALIKNEPRAASVVAKSNCKLLALDRMSFKRLLGPIENILKRQSDTYVKYLKK